MDLEFVDEYATQLATLLLANGWILDDSPHLSVQDLLVLFAEAPDPLLKGAGLDDSHDPSPKLVFGRLALIQLLNPHKNVFDQTVSQLWIVFRALANPCPMLDLAGYRTVVNSTYKTRLTHKLL